jgi:uncharacterized protein (DUF1800 family)
MDTMELPARADARRGIEARRDAPNPLSTDPGGTPPHIAALFAAVSAAAVLAACGGGGDSSPSAGGTGAVPGTPAPPAVPPTTAEAARFLQQAQFTSADADVAAVTSQGYAAWLSAQFNAPASTTGWDYLIAKGYNASGFENNSTIADNMIWAQLIESPDALRKRVALALSEIFVVSTTGIDVQSRAFAMAAWWDLLVANAFGNFRSLLEAVTLNPAMGVYLNTRGNQKEDAATGRQPDENYGREVMQLFTIGLYQLNDDGSLKTSSDGKPLETYDLNTVTNIARTFTGWDFDKTGATAITNPLQVRSPMTLNASRHSTLASNFLGVTVPANTDGRAALRIPLDTLGNHPNNGPFFGRQLIQRLVTSNPSPGYVARVAAAFNNDGTGVRGNLKAVVAAVLLDPEARAATGLSALTWGKLREPMVRFVQWARSFKAVPAGAWAVGDLSDPASRLGQSPLRSPSVFNFFRPGYVPQGAGFSSLALVAPELQIVNESTVAAWVNFMQGAVQNGFGGLVADYSAEIALAADPVALVDRLNLLLAANQLSAATVSTIRTAITSIAATTPAGQKTRVQAAVLLVLASPEYLAQK